MSWNRSCRRGRWEPYPCQAGPPPPCAHGPQDAWCNPPWEQQHWRARSRAHLPCPRHPRPFPGPADRLQREENWRSANRNRDVPPPPWMYREHHQSHEPSAGPLRSSCVRGSRLGQHLGKMSWNHSCRRGRWEPYPRQAGPPPPRAHGPQDAWCSPPWEQQRWRARSRAHLPGPRHPRPFPGPADICRYEENWRWASQNCDVPPPPWMYREDQQSGEMPQLGHRDFFAQPEFPSQEQRPAGFHPRQQEVFWDDYSPQHHCGPRRRRCRLLRSIREESASLSRSPRSSQGFHPSSKPSRSCSPLSQQGVREHHDAPQSPAASKTSLQSEQQVEEVEPEGAEEGAGKQQLSGSGLEPVTSETSSTSQEEGLAPIPLEAPAEPNTQPSEAGSDISTETAAAPRTGQPPLGWTELAAGLQSLPRPPRSAHSPSSTDPRFDAILAKKESIEQGYHNICLNFAAVSIMLLQKEPSMGEVLMKALRANLRELRNHLIKELEAFMQEFDVTHPSC